MADVTLGPGQGGLDEIDFTFDDGEEGKVDHGDFDFDLEDGEEEQGPGPIEGDVPSIVFATPETRGNIGETNASHDQEAYSAQQDGDGSDVGKDEIDYEDQDEAPAAHDSSQTQIPSGSTEGQINRPDPTAEGHDEIDYQEVDHRDPLATGGSLNDGLEGGLAVPEAAGLLGTEVMNDPLGENGFGVSNPVEVEVPAYQTAAGALGDVLDVELQDISGASHIGNGVGSSLFANQLPDELDLGLAQFGDSYATSPPDVTVTWGDEVCPLCKTSDGDDPSSFYIEDLTVLNLPLSAFLANVRKNISSWVDQNDEIHIRVEELGLEFSETTTEALLNQVTFFQLVALHDRLAKNDDPTASVGLNLILTTRANCTLRLRELVNGAGSGKGLSTFRSQHSPDESSAVSNNDEIDSDAQSPSEDISDGAAEPQDSIAAGTDGQEDTSHADGSAGSENEEEEDMIDYEDTGEGIGEHGAEEDLDILSYSNEQDLVGDVQEQMGDNAEAYGNDTDLTTQANPNPAVEGGFDDAVDDLLSFDDDDASNNEGDEADLLGYSGGPGGNIGNDGQEHDDPQKAYANAAQPDEDQQIDTTGADGDEYLDLGDDADPNSLLDLNEGVDETPVTDKVIPRPAQASSSAHLAQSQHTSATTTLNGDEIDYEDGVFPTSISGHNPENSNNGPAGIDEIDWDDEDKILAPNANSSTPTNLKRNREVDDAEELFDDGHDDKRQRPENMP